jgi:2-polyprenyl-3-methyl-5-hydroxy-6-metoxy-1,4-benzoquinol methylase
MIFILRKSQLPLFGMPVHVAGSYRKDGTYVKPHMRTAHVAMKPHEQGHLFGPAPEAPKAAKQSPKLDKFLAKHGGPARMRSTLMEMRPEQRAKLIDAMAHIDDITAASVVERLGMHVGDLRTPEPEPMPAKEAEPVIEAAKEAAAPAEKEPVEAETPVAEEKPAAPAHDIVEHTTGKGKVLRGVVRTDLTQAEAKAIDAYTFKKDGGWFIREKHLDGATPAAAPRVMFTKPAEKPAEVVAVPVVDKSKEQAAKLRTAGAKLADQANADLGRDRNANTARRARMAAGAEADASKRLAIAGTMINLADAIESGEARHLKGISTRAAVESLDESMRNAMYATDRDLSYVDQQRAKGRAPTPDDIRNAKIYRPSWGTGGADKPRLIEKLQGKRGAKPLIERLRASSGPDGAMVKDLKKYLDEKDIRSGLGWWNDEQIKKVDRLARIGITNDHELRLALTEYLVFRDGVKKEDPIKAAERALVGKKVGIDFFPTPKPLAAKMAEMAGVKPGMSVLEPSAGNGHLADAARDAGATVDAIEISDTLRNVLSAKGHNIAAHDFDTFEPGKQYDAVIMNPPFSDRKDAAHIMRAYNMLKPGGKLVAIAGEGVFFGSDQKAQGFRSWLDEHGADVEKLPENTFKGSDLPSQTGANARLLVVTKPAEAAAAPAPAEKPMKNFGWDAVKLADAYSMDELSKLRAQVEAEHANPFDEKTRYTENGKSTLNLYDQKGMKKLQALAWAVTYKLQEKRAAADAGPKEGDRNAEGLVFRGGRWHREEEPAAAVEEGAPAQFDSRREAMADFVERGGNRDDAVAVKKDGKWIATSADRAKQLEADGWVNPLAIDADRPMSVAESLKHLAGDKASSIDFEGLTYFSNTVGLKGLSDDEKLRVRNAISLINHMAHTGRLDGTEQLKLRDKLRGAAVLDMVEKIADRMQTVSDPMDAVREYFHPEHKGADKVEPAAEPAMPPATNPDVDLAEDREDLADELARDPHSEKAKELVKKVAERVAARDEPVEVDVDRPSSENYRYADTGHIGGSRKERAALEVITRAKKEGARVFATAIDWDALEQNPREAKSLITKSNLFGTVDWDALRAGGMEPGAGFLVDRIYAAIGQEPSADNPSARQDYAIGLQSLRDRLEGCKTPAEVTGVLDNLREEFEGAILTAEESEQYQAHGEASGALANESREIDAGNTALYNEMQKTRVELYRAREAVENRKRRGWAPKPELDEKLADLEKVDAAATKLWGDTLQGNKPRRDEIDDARSELGRKREVLKLMAKVRNQTENPLHRAWNLMGDRFVGVIKYRSYKGSDAFANHVAAAKVGKIGWDWMEKEQKRAPRISKESARFQLKVADTFERVGGRTVMPDSTMALKEMFGLRDVQSGNWVLRDVASAKFHTEHTAGAFADLADLMGADDAHVSLNGRLAMAFGARGNGAAGGGAAKAHYEPIQRVINLTKMGGGGALSHEWFHALDNMAKEAEGMGAAGQDDFITENPHLLPPGELRDATIALRSAMLDGTHQHTELISYTASDVKMAQRNLNGTYPNAVARSIRDAGTVHDAFKAIDAVFPDDKTLTKKRKSTREIWRLIAAAHFGGNPEGGAVEVKQGKGMSSFAFEASKLDTGSKEYWQLTHEMAARAFQSWVEDRLSDKGRRNDYLSSLADNRFHVDPLTGVQWKPYPEGDERVKINAAFDRFVAAVKKADTLAKALELV